MPLCPARSFFIFALSVSCLSFFHMCFPPFDHFHSLSTHFSSLPSLLLSVFISSPTPLLPASTFPAVLPDLPGSVLLFQEKIKYNNPEISKENMTTTHRTLIFFFFYLWSNSLLPPPCHFSIVPSAPRLLPSLILPFCSFVCLSLLYC